MFFVCLVRQTLFHFDYFVLASERLTNCSMYKTQRASEKEWPAHRRWLSKAINFNLCPK